MSEGKPARYTVLVVPEDAAKEVVHLELTRRRIKQLTWGAGLALGVLSSLALAGLIGVDRMDSHHQLTDENRQLRDHLHDIEAKLDRVDSAMRRVQLYDSQLRDAIGSSDVRAGGFGPLDADEAEAIELDATDTGDLDGFTPADGAPMDDLGEELLVDDLRPAEAWAMAVSARTDDFLRKLERLEPRMGLLAEDVEDYLSISAAFPSVWPVDGVLTSGFGYRRSPINNRWKFHSGIDLSAPRGTRVRSASPGVVTMARYNAGYGRMIAIDHGYSIESRYAHNSSLFVKEGDWVDAGQIIATVGTTGQSTGPHLHFEVMVDGEAVDPLEYLPD